MPFHVVRGPFQPGPRFIPDSAREVMHNREGGLEAPTLSWVRCHLNYAPIAAEQRLPVDSGSVPSLSIRLSSSLQ